MSTDNQDFRADLHCHTTCSDGTSTPEEMIHLAIKKGLSGLSITDHDTAEAYKTAVRIAKELSFPLIPGIEFSSMHKNISVHILGYSYDLNDPIIAEFCAKHKRRRKERNLAILDLLKEKGMPISPEDIQGNEEIQEHTIGRPHIALAMLKKGYISTLQEAFNEYIGNGKPCYVTGGYFTAEETIDIIHKAKGLAIIAHPHLLESKEILNELLEMPFDGIEGYYAHFSPQQNEKWIKIGKERKWIITGGSDFHGTIKPTNHLGSSWVGKETFDHLYNHYLKNC